MHKLDILVGQIQRKQEYESMGMVQALKTMAEKTTNLNNSFIYDKGSNLFSFINWIGSNLNPILNRNITSFFVLKDD
jgi:hypothetical protein